MRRLLSALLFLGFTAVGALSAYLLYGHYLTWLACADRYGRCFDAAGGGQLLEATGLPLAYASITLVLALLSLAAFRGMFRRRTHA